MLFRDVVPLYGNNYKNNSVRKMQIFNIKADGACVQQPLCFNEFSFSLLHFEEVQCSMYIRI